MSYLTQMLALTVQISFPPRWHGVVIR